MDDAAALIASVDGDKQMIDLQNVHRSPLMELVHCAREAANTAKAAKQLAMTTKVDVVKDTATAAANSAKHTEFLARKLACRLNVPVQAGQPFLPTLARSECGDFVLSMCLSRDATGRRGHEFI
jgi:hypothetical protein